MAMMFSVILFEIRLGVWLRIRDRISDSFWGWASDAISFLLAYCQIADLTLTLSLSLLSIVLGCSCKGVGECWCDGKATTERSVEAVLGCGARLRLQSCCCWC